jgi:plastocyanin
MMTKSNFLYKSTIGLLAIVLLFSCSPAKQKNAYQSHIVKISRMQFQPAVLTLQKGDTVVFVNEDLVAHNVTELSNKAWSSSTLPSGQSWKMVVNRSAQYYCSIHPTMKGSLVVQQLVHGYH